MKRSRFIAVLVLSALMFGVVQPAFAHDTRSTEEVAAETAGGAFVGALLGAAAVFFTGGAALPFVLGGAAIGATAGFAGEKNVKNFIEYSRQNSEAIDAEVAAIQNGKVLYDMYTDYKNGQFKGKWDNGTYDRQFWEINAPYGLPYPFE